MIHCKTTIVDEEACVLAEELHIVDANAPAWPLIRPLLNSAMLLEQNDTLVWHGWNKAQITTLLTQLPTHCTILAGVWSSSTDEQQQEHLILSCVCEVRNGEVQTVRTFETLVSEELPSIQVLEPGFEHALEIMRVVRQTIAPVAWALFTDKATWDEWVYSGNENVIDKGAMLAFLAAQGRCVLMGSQARNNHL